MRLQGTQAGESRDCVGFGEPEEGGRAVSILRPRAAGGPGKVRSVNTACGRRTSRSPENAVPRKVSSWKLAGGKILARECAGEEPDLRTRMSVFMAPWDIRIVLSLI